MMFLLYNEDGSNFHEFLSIPTYRKLLRGVLSVIEFNDAYVWSTVYVALPGRALALWSGRIVIQKQLAIYSSKEARP
jgi:hypothetical protein